MAQISGKGSKGHHTFYLKVTETGTSTANNTSTVDISFSISASGWYWAQWGSAITYSFSVGGNSYSGSIPEIPNNQAYTIRRVTGLSIPHNDDGTKSISLSFSVKDGANQDYTCGNASGSGTMTLTNIPRASSISSITSSVNIGSTCSIGISKKVSSYTSTLEYQISGSSTWTSIASKWNPNTNLSQTYDWTVPTSVYNSMSSTETQKTITIRLTTYNGSTAVGSQSSSSFTAKATGTPSISSYSVVDTNTTTTNLTSDSSKMVNGISNMKVTVNAAGVNGTTITKITCNGTTMSLSNGTGTLTYNNCTTTSFAIVVTDSRNATKSQTIDISSKKINYVALTANMSATKDQPTSASAIISVKGDFSATAFATGVTNTLTASFQYRLAGTSNAFTSGTFNITYSGNTYTATKTITGLDYTKDYEVKIAVNDKLKSFNKTITLKKGVPVFYWDKDSVYLKSGNPILDYTKPTTQCAQYKDASGNEVYPNPYPIGGIYLSWKSTSPASIFGGTWERLRARYLYCRNSDTATEGELSSATGVNATGGSGTTGSTAITVDQMPSHTHTQNSHNHYTNYAPSTSGSQGEWNYLVNSGTSSTSGKGWGWNMGVNSTTASNNSTGGDKGHDHSIPSHNHTIAYASIFVWRRTA